MINRARPVWIPARSPATIKEPACSACPTYPTALQIWDGSLRQTAERLKTTISPFSYPRRPRFFNPFLASKTKRSSRSSCTSRRDPPNSHTLFHAHASFGTEIASPQTHRDILGFTAVLTKQNAVCWCGEEMHFWMNLSCMQSGESQRSVERFLANLAEGYTGFWWCCSLSISLSLSCAHTHTHTHSQRHTQPGTYIILSQRNPGLLVTSSHIKFRLCGQHFQSPNHQCLLGLCP